MKTIKKIITILMLTLTLATLVNAADNDFAKLTETLLNQDPDPAEPGEYVELRFKVEKSGNNPLEQIKYELIPSYPFSFDSSDTSIKNLNDWVGNSDEDEFYTLYYKLRVDKDAIEDTYELTLRQTSSNSQLTREIDFDIRVGEPKTPELLIGDVQTAPAKLIADYNEASITIEFVNNGEEDAKQVIAELNLPEGFEESFGYSTRKNIGTIMSGETQKVTFFFDTLEELNKGKHNTSISLTYKENTPNSQDETKTIEIPFEIDVFGRPSYKIEVVSIDELNVGDIGKEFKILVKNVGSFESESTSVQVFKDSSQPFSFDDKSDFIGKLNVGEEIESVFVFDVDEEAIAKDYKLKLQIRSVVEGNVLVEDESITLPINTTKKPSPGENKLYRYMFYITFLVLGIFIGMRIGKKKSLKKSK